MMCEHCTHALTSDATIVKLVSRQRWHQLAEALQRDDQIDFDNRKTSRLPEEHILHLACQNQAPNRLIEILDEKYPQSASTAENKGRYPLHIACAKGLSPSTIDFLIKSHPAAAGTQDEYGKTPLHYVAESYAYNFRTNLSNAYRSPDKSMCKIISALLREFPELPNVEDLYGMNAIEYAIENDVDIKLIKHMQNMSRENWRTMRQRHRGKSHEDLRHSLTSLGSLCSSFNSSCVISENNNMRRRESNETKDVLVPPTPMEVAEAKVQSARTA